MLSAPRSIAVGLTALSLLGCSSWQPVTAPLPEHIASQPQRSIRLTLTNGQRLELEAPQVLLDSVIGYTPGGLRARTAIALVEVAEAEQLQSDGGKTVTAVVGGAGVAAAIFYVALLADYCSSGWC